MFEHSTSASVKEETSAQPQPSVKVEPLDASEGVDRDDDLQVAYYQWRSPNADIDSDQDDDSVDDILGNFHI